MTRRIEQSFRRQGFMRSIGAQLDTVGAGSVTISCRTGEHLTQQHGLLHGGAIASIADVACGYAALTMMPDGNEVLTVEFKANFLKPANTERVVAIRKGHSQRSNADGL